MIRSGKSTDLGTLICSGETAVGEGHGDTRERREVCKLVDADAAQTSGAPRGSPSGTHRCANAWQVKPSSHCAPTPQSCADNHPSGELHVIDAETGELINIGAWSGTTADGCEGQDTDGI